MTGQWYLTDNVAILPSLCSRRPAPVLQGYDSFPRFFIRRVFRAGLVIAMRWEGRAKNGTCSEMNVKSLRTTLTDIMAVQCCL